MITVFGNHYYFLEQNLNKNIKQVYSKILYQKILYTLIIILVYIVGRCLPLVGVDVHRISYDSMDMQNILMSTIGGDRNNSSVFALGISPLIMSSILIQVLRAIQGQEARAKTSPKKQMGTMYFFFMIIALFQAILRVSQLPYRFSGGIRLMEVQSLSVVELLTGSLLIVWLISRNKKYGIGGQSILIFVNILDQIFGVILDMDRVYFSVIKNIIIAIAILLVVILVTVLMESIEIRMPIQRISIHNIHADKNYLAFKFNPIGVMPIMFASAVYMVPRVFIMVLSRFYPENRVMPAIIEATELNTSLGICLYVLVIFLLNYVYSFITINPADISEQFLKSGDSLEDIRAGKATRKYLAKKLAVICFFSSCIMSGFIVVPMILRAQGTMNPTIASMIPTIMILTGIWVNIYREIAAIGEYDSYKPII